MDWNDDDGVKVEPVDTIGLCVNIGLLCSMIVEGVYVLLKFGLEILFPELITSWPFIETRLFEIWSIPTFLIHYKLLGMFPLLYVFAYSVIDFKAWSKFT